MKQAYAVLLPRDLPQELLVFLEGYLFLLHEQNFLLCSDLTNQGNFLEMSALRNDNSKKEWRVRLPTQYALGVADVSDKDNFPIGFLS